MAKPEVEEEQMNDAMALPGAHVTVSGTFIGTYPTAEDADEFIRCHIEPQGLKAKVTVVE